jgi:hypothetical protein
VDGDATNLEYFTLTSPYFFELHEQASASVTNSRTATMIGADQGYLFDYGRNAYVDSWSLASGGPGSTVSRDVTLTGVLYPGKYLLDNLAYADGVTTGALGSTGSQQAQAQQTLSLNAVPEPASLTLLGLGGMGFLAYRWRRLRTA